MKPSRPHGCNILSLENGRRHLWQFATSGSRVSLAAESDGKDNTPLPARTVRKDWTALFQPRLNVAWLPPEQVFLRALSLPAPDPKELPSMLELQLEKLSPLPVAQAVWTYEVLPVVNPDDPLRTVVVVIVPRQAVEDFLGRIEGQGYLADRLEIPFLHQLLATRVETDGVWLYPELAGNQTRFLVAWWYGGVLRDLNLLRVPSLDSRAEVLAHQITQTAWAGELEGWLTHPPRWHLVADPELTAAWEPLLRAQAGDTIEVIPVLSARELAERAAHKAARGEHQANLLPPEYTARYRQQFIDRLWMRGLGAAALIYICGVLIYLAVVQVYQFQKGRLERQVAALDRDYRNAQQLKARAQILQDQYHLRFAALNCLNAAAELLPDGVTLNSFAFQRGRTMALLGTAPGDAVSKVADYNEALAKVSIEGPSGAPLFASVNSPAMQVRPAEGGRTVISWSFAADLKRGED
jgi:hypothetical protein